jgi:hypothetical protein
MPHSIVISLVAFVIAMASAYAIIRPIGNLRRYIGGLLVSLIVTATAATFDAVIYGATLQRAIEPAAIAVIVGWSFGVAIAHYRRARVLVQNSPGSERPHGKRHGQSMWHDHAVRRS